MNMQFNINVTQAKYSNIYKGIFETIFPQKKGGCLFSLIERLRTKEYYINTSHVTIFLLQIISTNDWQGFLFDDCKQKLIRRKDQVNLEIDKAAVFKKCKAKTERKHRKRKQHTNEMQGWEATEKRWLKLKSSCQWSRVFFLS